MLVEIGAFDSRARAQAAIKAGLVRVEGKTVDKPSQMIASNQAVESVGDVHPYVSRGGVKLAAALDAFDISPRDCVCLDLGASTGGFTDVLLRRGARRVYAVDVGAGQLHPAIRSDARVANLERTHAKTLTSDLVPAPIDLFVCDVSFISVKKVLRPALALAAPSACLAALIKPQFELGPAFIGKKGLVDASGETIERLLTEIEEFLTTVGWRTTGVIDSPIAGGDGNKEHLIGAVKAQ